jgi:NADPH:quinone reductase-like Zn-dependent oxidoreductase
VSHTKWSLQLAAAAGATVIATSSSDEKLEIARSLGATHLINYKKTPEWGAEVLRITNGRGADHVVDIAGAGTIEQSIQATKQGGLVSLIGFLTESKATDLVAPIIVGAKTIHGILGMSNRMLEKVVDLYEEHQLRPPISKIFQWHEAKDAYAELVNQSGVGKIIIEVKG